MTRQSPTVSFSTWTQLAFWLILITFITSISTVLIGWPEALYRTAFITGCHMLIFYSCYSWLVPGYYEQKKNIGKALGLFVLVLLVVTPLRILAERSYLSGSLPMLPGTQAGRIGFILFTEVAVGGFASLLRLASSRERTQTRVAELERMNLEAELKFLKNQMSPHFLFNTLNNIYSLALIKADQTPEAIMKLSELLRYMIYDSAERVTLEKEWKAIQSFRDLFQLKFETRLNIRLNCNLTGADHIRLEPHLIVPLLENAFKHGSWSNDSRAYAEISVEKRQSSLVIRAENSIGAAGPVSEVGGIGLDNIRKRLERAYPNQHAMTITKDDRVFVVQIELPVS